MKRSPDRKVEGEEIASANDSESEDIHVSDNDSEETESNTLDHHVTP